MKEKKVEIGLGGYEEQLSRKKLAAIYYYVVTSWD